MPLAARADPTNVPHVLLRALGSRGDHAPPAAAIFEAAPGDAVVLLSEAHLVGPDARVEEAAAAATVDPDAASRATRLADLAFARSDSPFAAVAVLCFEAADALSGSA